MSYGIIYGFIDTTNWKIYIGQTKQSLKRRINQHKSGKQYVDKVLRKHGWENVIVEVIEECETKEQLNEREKIGAPKRGKKLSAEHRVKLAAAKMGEKNHNFGKHLTDEQKAHLSAMNSGENNANFGKKASDETRAKLSASHRGNSPYKNLLAELDSRQFSYVMLGEHLGVSASSVGQKMRYKQNFTAAQIAKLVEIFGKPAEYLMQRNDK